MSKFFRKSMAGVHPGVAQSAFTAVEALESRTLYSASTGGQVVGSLSAATPPSQLAQQGTSANSILGFSAITKSSGNVLLTWTTPLPAAGSISIISTAGRQSFPALSLPAGATGVQIANVHPGWSIDFQVTSGSLASTVATVLVAGSNAAPYSGNPAIQSVVTAPVVPIPPVTPSAGILGFAAASTSSGTVQLSWTTPLAASGTLSIITTQGRQAFPSLTLAAGATSVTVQNVHAGWQIDFQITSAAQTSTVATVVVAGSYSAPYSGNPTVVTPGTTPPVVSPPIVPPHVAVPPIVVTPVITTPPATGGGGTLLDGAAMPGPTNTGPTNPSILTPSGSIVVRTAGAVIQNLAVTGTIEIEAPNVTVKNCTINANGNYDALQIDAGANNCTVEDTSVTGTGTGGFAIETNAAIGNTFLRMNVYNTGDQGFHLGGASTVQGCWLHEIGWNAAGIKSNPSKPGFNGLDHVEDFFIETGASFNFTDNNFQTPDFVTINGVNYGTTTAVFFIDPYSTGDHVGHVTINSNYIDGGGYMFYLMGQGPYTISNNIIGPNEQYALIYSSYIGGPWSWLNNVDQNGNSIAVPTGLPVAGTS